MASLKLGSSSFSNGDKIPSQYGYKNENKSPPLEISGTPSNAKSLALVMDDPDAMKPAGKVWVHWVLWNIDPSTSKIDENSIPSDSLEGKTDFDKIGYGGPAPPDKEHTYVFKLYALDSKLDLKKGATKPELESAMKGHIIEEAKLEGKFAP